MNKFWIHFFEYSVMVAVLALNVYLTYKMYVVGDKNWLCMLAFIDGATAMAILLKAMIDYLNVSNTEDNSCS